MKNRVVPLGEGQETYAWGGKKFIIYNNTNKPYTILKKFNIIRS